MIQRYQVSARRACKLVKLSRTAYTYQAKRAPQDVLRKRIRELAESRVRYGYKRIHVLLKRERIHVNKKRVHRLYCLEGLQLCSKRPRRRVSAAHRVNPSQKATKRNESWAMDFVSDQLQDGTNLRILTIVDTFTRECLAADFGYRMRSEKVVNALTRITAERGTPKRIYCDNGSEFAGRMTDLWAYANKVESAFSRPGKPTDNAYIESFNGSFRDECLNLHWFDSLSDARVKIEAWHKDYNESRAHRALNDLSPAEYAASLAT